MDFRTYFYSLSPAERAAFAKRADTSVGYIQSHLISKRKIPRPASMRKLVAASQDQLTLDDLLAHFYPPDRQADTPQCRC